MKILPAILSLFLLGYPLAGQEVFHFDVETLDLGKVMDQAGSVSRTFHFKHTGKKKAVLLDVSTSCSCLTVRYDRSPIAPGEEREIVLTFDPRNFSSEVEVQAFLYTDFSGKKPSNVLSLKADVQATDQWKHLPRKIGDLRLKRTKVLISEMGTSGKRKERIPVANAGRKPMKVSAQMVPSYARIYTEPALVPPGTEADLWIEIDGKELSQTRDRSKEVHFKALLQGTGGSMASRMIEVVVSPILNDKN